MTEAFDKFLADPASVAVDAHGVGARKSAEVVRFAALNVKGDVEGGAERHRARLVETTLRSTCAADGLRDANAKVHFVRLQAAWDEKNLADIRQFTTPEAFAEIRMQIDEDKGTQNRTDVVTLEAELLGIETGATDYLASVRFTGTMRENERSTPEAFDEVWNLSKPKDGQTGWLLAGIQQLH